MTKVKQIISLFHFNTFLAPWKGVVMPLRLPLLAASWMGDAKSQSGCRLAPCCSNKFKQATLPLTQALNNGVCQSTVTPFTWGKIAQSGFFWVFFHILSVSKLMKITQFLSRKQGFHFLFNFLKKKKKSACRLGRLQPFIKKMIKKILLKHAPGLSSWKRMLYQCHSGLSQELPSHKVKCMPISVISAETHLPVALSWISVFLVENVQPSFYLFF